MRRYLTQLALAFAALLTVSSLAAAQLAPLQVPKEAVAAPRCTGRDILAELREQQPAEWARIKEAADRTLNGRHIFWRIDGPKGPPSYLFGTIHLSDDRINALPVGVQLALQSAGKVVLEVADLSPKALAAAFAKSQGILVFADGRSLETLLTPEEKAIAREALTKAGIPAAALAAFKPWVVNMMLSLSDCERRRSAAGLQPLDLRLADNARGRGVPVAGLETLEDQLQALAAVPDTDQLTVLRAGLKLTERSDDVLETMVRSYLAREIGLILPMHELLWRQAGFEPKAFAAFLKQLVTKRNVRMRDAAVPLLAEGGAFVAVGALHLPGESGLVALLREAGYKVTPAE